LDFCMPIIYNETYRPSAAPARNLPFGVCSTGHYKITPPLVSHDYPAKAIHLFWCMRGSGIVEIAGRRRVLKRHQIAIYYPNMRHYYYVNSKFWELYWLTVDGPLAVSLLAAFGLEAGIYSAGPPPVKLFQALFQLVRQPTKQAELKACATAFVMLTRVAGSCADQTDELVNTAVERMHEQFPLPELNIKTLSALLGIRRAVLSARFHSAMGIPPGAYIDRLRLQHALSLLKHTHQSIATVAIQSGYADTHYFSRVIRRATGRSPLQFRKYDHPAAGGQNTRD